MAAVAFAVVPAHAAKMGGRCSSANLAKTETMIEGMADGQCKMMAQKELSAAQDSMLGGNRRLRHASRQGDARRHGEVSGFYTKSAGRAAIGPMRFRTSELSALEIYGACVSWVAK